jgi:hypothetical protein
MTKTAEENEPLNEMIHLVHEHIEGRYDLTAYDLGMVHSFLCSIDVTPLKKRIEELEAETTLYGVCFYSWDGGGSNSTLYRTIEEARAEMIADVNKKQKEQDDIYEDHDMPQGFEKWHAIDENTWTDGFDNVAIQTYTLNPSTNGKPDIL